MSSVFESVKVPAATKEQIKLASALLGLTMGELIEDAVAEFTEPGLDMIEANQAAILAKQPRPYPNVVYIEEIRKRRKAA